MFRAQVKRVGTCNEGSSDRDRTELRDRRIHCSKRILLQVCKQTVRSFRPRSGGNEEEVRQGEAGDGDDQSVRVKIQSRSWQTSCCPPMLCRRLCESGRIRSLQRTAIVDVSNSPRMSESTSREEGRTPTTLSKGVLEAVVEDDDDGRAETVHAEPGASSSDKTLRHCLTTGNRVSGDRGRGAGRSRCRTARDGRDKQRLHQTR